jgi:hypothetical protein
LTFCVTDPELALILSEGGAPIDHQGSSRVLPLVAAGLFLASVVMLVLA